MAIVGVTRPTNHCHWYMSVQDPIHRKPDEAIVMGATRTTAERLEIYTSDSQHISRCQGIVYQQATQYKASHTMGKYCSFAPNPTVVHKCTDSRKSCISPQDRHERLLLRDAIPCHVHLRHRHASGTKAGGLNDDQHQSGEIMESVRVTSIINYIAVLSTLTLPRSELTEACFR